MYVHSWEEHKHMRTDARATLLVIIPVNYSWDGWPLKLDAERGIWVSSRRQMKWNEMKRVIMPKWRHWKKEPGSGTFSLKRMVGKNSCLAPTSPTHPPLSHHSDYPFNSQHFSYGETLKIPAWPRGGDVHTQLPVAGNLLTSQCPAQVEDVCVYFHTHTLIYSMNVYKFLKSLNT